MSSPLVNYEVIKTLGEGGYGQALLVKDKKDGQRYVMKKVRLTALKPKDRAEALREAQVLASLRCDNIVQYKESFEERGYFYIIMEYADGGDLAQKIQKRGKQLFSESEILHDFIQIAIAIKYIHDRKILHRDLKAQNVFLMKDGTVKLGDFGIARVLENTFQLCKTQIGTPYYLSPEMCEGKNYNSKTDIWSLGCILYELCTLKHPFNAANVNGLLMVIIRGKYQPISSYYSQNLKSLVQQMLTKDPAKRPSIDQILGIPFIKAKLSSFLSPALLAYEMGHTVLHGRKPLAAPTIVLSKEKDKQRGTPPQASRKIVIQPTNRKRTSPRQAEKKKETERFRQMAREMDEQRKIADSQKKEEERKAEFEKKKKREIEELKRQAEEAERRKHEAERRRILDEKREKEREEEEKRRAIFDEEQRKKQEAEAERAREREEQRQRNLAEIQKKKAAEAKKMARQLKEQREQRLARIRMERAHAEEEEQRELERLRQEDEERSQKKLNTNDDESDGGCFFSALEAPQAEEESGSENKSLGDSFVFRSQDSIPSWANGPTRHVSLDGDIDLQAASEPEFESEFERLRVPETKRKKKLSYEDTDIDERREMFEENKRQLRENRAKIRGHPTLTPHKLASNDDIYRRPVEELTERERYELFKTQLEERRQNQLKISGSSPKRGSPRLLAKEDLLSRNSASTSDYDDADVVGKQNLVQTIKDALDLPSYDENGQAEAGFEADNSGQIVYADGKELHFPVAHDAESRSYRAEELRAYLIRKIGRDTLLKVFQEIRLYEDTDDAETPTCNRLDPELVIMAQQLMYLEQCDDNDDI